LRRSIVAPKGPTEEPADVDGDPYALARDQSFGFFYDVTNEHWRLWQTIYSKHENHRYPNKPLTYHPDARADQADRRIRRNRKDYGPDSYPAWWQNNYEPNFSCPFEMRVGVPMNGDGPKWVCDPHRIVKLAKARKEADPGHPGCVIYSIGSNGDFGFEMGMQNTVGEGVCEFHIFDPGNFEHLMPPGLKRATYHRWGLEKQKPRETNVVGTVTPLDKGKKFYGLIDIVELLGHKRLDVIDVFKIDCEGCEWDTYKDWLSNKVPLLHQIQVEVHKAPVKEDAGAIDLFDSFEREGYLRFHKEPNIQWNPDCLEYAFIKVDKVFVEG